jgi:4'-phosphopantetheinyl transferase
MAGFSSVKTDVADVWLIRLDMPGECLARLEEMLDGPERARARLLAGPGRRSFVATHGAARVILGRWLGVAPERIRWRRGRDGKPAISGMPAGPEVSFSTSGGYAALAAVRHRAVGVDLQQWLAVTDPVLIADRFWPPAEARFVAAAGPADRTVRLTQLWTRKEACVKAAGGRLMQGMKLPVAGAGPVIVRNSGGALSGPYLVQDMPAPHGFQAAVAVDGDRACRVRVHRWPSGHERAAEDRPVAAGRRSFSDVRV